MAGFLNIIGKLFGSKYDKDVKEIMPIVQQINEEFEKLNSHSNNQLREKTKELKSEIQEFTKIESEKIKSLKIESEKEISDEEKENLYDEIDKLEQDIVDKTEDILNQILPSAFAIVKETARRLTENETIIVKANDFDRDLSATKDFVSIDGENAIYKNEWTAAGTTIQWNMIHYDVQLIGGIVMHQGKIAEMQTGEGKTLSATLPIFLNALAGKGVHLITVNNYLAKRDAEWMGPIFQFHGLSVDCIDNHAPNSESRKNAYLSDVTYGTNNEFGFDYLRDNMAKRPQDLVQRKHHYSIVDEVDSVLIDDARTPLIISGPTPRGDVHEFNELKHKIETLVSAQKRYVNTVLSDSKKLLKEGNKEDGGFNLLRAFRGLPKNKALIKYLSEEGIKAQLQKTENFYMQEQSKEMPKVDEELYFVIEEKQNTIELTEKGIDLMTTDGESKDFFIMPDVGGEISKINNSSLSESEKSSQKETLMRDFSIKSERIHTINQLLKAYTLFEKDVEYVVMDNKVKIVDEQTGRIMDGRRYSDGLHQAIEAKENVKIEASTQTFATITLQNYFRMYNKLAGMTGTAETEAGEFWEIYKLDVVAIPTNRPVVREDKDDWVYKTNREKYNAVIEEIVKLTDEGRPILVGTTSVEISELLGRILKTRGIKHNILNAKLHQREADIVAEAGNSSVVTIATNMAGRGTDIKLTEEVKQVGGLAIIGTERHDSRRVDRQLRGRSGRQGDPGSSQFFVSLEDNLMRLFGSDRIAKLMDRMGLEEGEVISHSMVNKSIERAQTKIEENNFGTRKRLLEYDDVMNNQREIIYKKRKHALFGERLSLDVSNMIYDTCYNIVSEHHELKNYSDYSMDIMRILAIDSPISEDEFDSLNIDEVTDSTFSKCISNYKLKSEKIAEKVLPNIKNVFENESATYKNIVIPFTDGMKTLQVTSNLEEAVKSEGKNIPTSIEKSVTLAMIDDFWKEHLREMDELKQSVQNAVYEQKDPLLIYKFESFELFKVLMSKINKDIVSFLLKSDIYSGGSASIQEEKIKKQDDNLQMSRESDIPDGNPQAPQNKKPQRIQPVRAEQKIERNAPCPCGSGKKYKKCHGR
ncbi:MAG: preprotein translocase subunit SecA [Flavobacteriales bacterium]|nr:preprotein translocase subunit SecA [Flavobacteriales bacterium]